MRHTIESTAMPALRWFRVLTISVSAFLLLALSLGLWSPAFATSSNSDQRPEVERPEDLPWPVPEDTVPPSVTVRCAVERNSPYGEWTAPPSGARMRPVYQGPQVSHHNSVWWEFHFSEYSDYVPENDERGFTITGQDDTEFYTFAIGAGAGGNYGRYYLRELWGTIPRSRLTREVSEVSGVIISALAGGWQDIAGNHNTASGNSLYLAHNWQVSVADARGEEGTDETIDFEVTLNARDDCKTVTVDWATVDGTATAGEDYTAASGTLTFAPGETSKTVSITMLDDTVEDSGETFTLQLSNASTVTLAGVSLTLADAEATGTIFNSESPFESVPQIAGAAQVANTLQVSFAEAPSGTLTYQWLRGSEDIAGATASTYAPTATDVGEVLSVQVTSDGDSIASAATVPVWAAPVNPPLADGEEELLSTTMTLGWHQFPYWVAGYGRVKGESFGEMNVTSFEEGGATYTISAFLVNAIGTFALATGSDLPEASGLVAYWNDYRISGLRTDTVDGGTLSLLVGDTPQPVSEYNRYDFGASDGVRVAVSLRRTSVAVQEPLTAEFRGLPEKHGNDAFTFKLRFTEEFGLSYRTLQDHALTVTNGQLTGVARAEQGKNQVWNLTVTPNDDQDVTVALAETTDCTATGAICTDDDRPLSAAITATVPETDEETTAPPAVQPFQVRFEDIDDEHDGTSPIVFKVMFNKRPKGDYSYVTMRDRTLSIQQGEQSVIATNARRLNRPHNDEWEITIDPVSKADLRVGIAAPASCSDIGAVCTEDNELLSNSISKTIQGPPSLSVADARVREAANATVDFTVTLSRGASETVTVDYATSDGTATAGEDYTSTSGTLTFAAGETSKTVQVPVLDDSIDEGEETFTLTLSNASGGNTWLNDSTATGTIENDDPMPKAWLARFGRTVASQAIDAVGGRLEGDSSTHVTVGGQPLSLSGEPVDPEADEEVRNVLEALSLADESGGTTRSMSGREALIGSSFQVSSNGGAGAPSWTAWGRFATGGFEADVDGTRMDGSVTTGFLGVDVGAGRWLTGIALGLSEGEGDYALIESEDRGDVESSLTGFYPYVRLGLTDNVDVWGLAGWGEGELTLTQAANANRAQERTYTTDISMRMGAVGARGEALSPTEPGDLTVAVKSDAFWVRTTSERVPGLMGAEADVTRMRLLVEGSRNFESESGALVPSIEVGVRHDGGDAETGTGIEAGAGLRYSSGHLSIEGSVRTLVAHEESGYEEWGASGAIRLSPNASGRGLSLTVAPSWGAVGGGTGQLWSVTDPQGLARDREFEAERRLEAEVGYGLSVPRNHGVVTPYAGLSVWEARNRAWRTGARWQLAPELALGLEVSGGTAAGGDADRVLTLRAQARF